MAALAVLIGAVVVPFVLIDMLNTLVTTTTSQSRWWPSRVVYLVLWRAVRAVASRIKSERARESLLSTFAQFSVLLLLTFWVTSQVFGFGLLWWGLGGISGAQSFSDSLYYSGVVYFTLGFGEVVPVDLIPRFGALAEAFAGVLTTALVIGYLPALYSAFSARETKLMMLDDGSEDRITPTNLVLSRAPTGSVDDILRFLEGWEDWIAEVIETHTTFPMLRFFRSKHAGQNWITALGVVTDAALQCQIIADARNRTPYWLLRRSIILFDELTDNADLAPYRERLDESYDQPGGDDLFAEMYNDLSSHGFELIPLDEAREETLELRRKYDAQMEYLIDAFLAPRGFWGHKIGHRAAFSRRELTSD